MEPLGERKTKATLMINIDLKGGLPNYAINKALKMQGSQFKPLREAIGKYIKEFPVTT